MTVSLMSIKPKWAKELYSGKKSVEFRKSSPPVGSVVFLYESAPVQAVTGAFVVTATLCSGADLVWSALKVLKVWKPGSVTREALKDYVGSAKCCAIATESPLQFSPAEYVKLEKYAVRPPQSWQALKVGHCGENALACTLLNLAKMHITKEVQHG